MRTTLRNTLGVWMTAAIVVGGMVASGQQIAHADTTCTNLAGVVGTDQMCVAHIAAPNYTIDFRFPVDYPQQQALTDYLTGQRDSYIDWVAGRFGGTDTHPYALDISGDSFNAGGDAPTQSLLLTIGEDIGVHPITRYKTFNYDLTSQTPITFDSLFAPGTDPLAVLNPIVLAELKTRGDGDLIGALDADAYRNFVLTDDAVVFYFDQGRLLPHEVGALHVSVPRSQLASVLALPAAAQVAHTPCDWVTSDEAAGILGLAVTETPYDNPTDPGCYWGTAGQPGIGVHIDVRLPDATPEAATAVYQQAATAPTATAVHGLGAEAVCVVEPQTTPPSATVLAQLSGDRLLRVTQGYASCDTLQQFAKLAIGRLEA